MFLLIDYVWLQDKCDYHNLYIERFSCYRWYQLLLRPIAMAGCSSSTKCYYCRPKTSIIFISSKQCLYYRVHPLWFRVTPSLVTRSFTDKSCADLCQTQHQFHSELCIPSAYYFYIIRGQYYQYKISIYRMVCGILNNLVYKVGTLYSI